MSQPASITCPRCGRTSHHPTDRALNYCGHCHTFNDPEDQETLKRLIETGDAVQQQITKEKWQVQKALNVILINVGYAPEPHCPCATYAPSAIPGVCTCWHRADWHEPKGQCYRPYLRGTTIETPEDEDT